MMDNIVINGSAAARRPYPGKRLRCRAGSLALVEKSSHGLRDFLRFFHEELVPGTGYAEVLGVWERSLHSFGSGGEFAVGLAVEQ